MGHSSGVLLVGLAFLQLREAWPADFFSAWAERIVGVALIGIGLWGLRKSLSDRVHAHEHVHEGQRHVHIHAHGTETSHRHEEDGPKPRAPAHIHTHAAFAVGTLHGLAGSSHLLGVVPAMAFPTKAEGAAYLVAYGVGTVLAMTLFSSAVGWLGRGGATGSLQAHRALMIFFSILAVGVGVYWLGSGLGV